MRPLVACGVADAITSPTLNASAFATPQAAGHLQGSWTMADRKVHYEAAFEAFLRHNGIPYVAVDEAKRAIFANAKLKSFDFVVYVKDGPNLLVDVKGRQHRDRTGRKTFECWTTERDIQDLMQWEQVFGEGFKAVLTFIYWIDPPLTPEPGMFEHRDRWY